MMNLSEYPEALEQIGPFTVLKQPDTSIYPILMLKLNLGWIVAGKIDDIIGLISVEHLSESTWTELMNSFTE